jgi:hypothetical protein
MAHDDQDEELARLWQTQPVEPPGMTLDDVHVRVRKMERTVGWRNLREYVAAIVVVGIFAFVGWRETNVIVQAGGWLIVMATAYVVYQLHTRGTVRRMPADLASQNCVDFYRTELVRQRDLLRSVWSWYLLPFVPGVAVILIGRAIERPERRLTALGVAVAFVGAFVLIGMLNWRVARKLQRRIDRLGTSQ